MAEASGRPARGCAAGSSSSRPRWRSCFWSARPCSRGASLSSFGWTPGTNPPMCCRPICERLKAPTPRNERGGSPFQRWSVSARYLGVRAAGAGDMAPFGSVLSGFGFTLPGMTTADGRPVVATALRAVVTPGYAEALGMRLKEGRFFRADDTTSAIRPMLVNDTFATTYFADGRPATGRRFTGIFPRWLGKDTVVEVVGVVGDMLPDALDARPQPQIFVAQGPRVDVGHATLVVKTEGDPASMAPLLRDIVQQLEPGATIERAGPLAAKISASVGEPALRHLRIGRVRGSGARRSPRLVCMACSPTTSRSAAARSAVRAALGASTSAISLRWCFAKGSSSR